MAFDKYVRYHPGRLDSSIPSTTFKSNQHDILTSIFEYGTPKYPKLDSNHRTTKPNSHIHTEFSRSGQDGHGRQRHVSKVLSRLRIRLSLAMYKVCVKKTRISFPAIYEDFIIQRSQAWLPVQTHSKMLDKPSEGSSDQNSRAKEMNSFELIHDADRPSGPIPNSANIKTSMSSSSQNSHSYPSSMAKKSSIP